MRTVSRFSIFLGCYCCDRKSLAAYVQSFALWQQATIEITCHDHSVTLNYCLFAPHICMMLFFAHIPFVVNHTINATPPERLQQHPLLFTTNRTDRTFFLWRLHPARPSHPGHSTIFLRSEIPSGMCAKLRTVAASNNRDHPTRSLSSSPFASTINCSPGSQALLEVTHQDHSIGISLLLLVRATYMYGVVLHAHPVRGESHNQRNTTREVATIGLGCSVKSCTFLKMDVDGTHGTRVFHWSLNS